jgi:hypothetical protein
MDNSKRKFLTLLGLDLQAVQPVASCYTDYATTAIEYNEVTQFIYSH